MVFLCLPILQLENEIYYIKYFIFCSLPSNYFGTFGTLCFAE